MTRKIVLCSFAVATLVALTMSRVAIAQVDWTWQSMVVPPGEPGDWDSNRHMVGDVVFDGTNYHMFLLGGQTFTPWTSSWAVGHWTWNATTQEWEEDSNNPVLSPEPGQWDGYTIWDLAVIHDGAKFKMWYGATASFPGPTWAGYAESLDGSDWDKDLGNPLPSLAPGAPGEWDDRGVIPGAVLFDGAEYRMWYGAVKEGGPAYGTWRLGYGTSTNGIDWIKHPDPVLVGSLPWEGNNVYHPEVIPYAGGYAMWYSGVTAGGIAAIGYAVSPDGIHWGRWPGNPVLTPSCPDNVIESLNVIVEGDAIHGWLNHCLTVDYQTSLLEVVFFDAFETGDTAIWSSVVP